MGPWHERPEPSTASPWRVFGWALLVGALLSLPASADLPAGRAAGLPPDTASLARARAEGPVYVVEAYPRVGRARFPGLTVLAEWEGTALVAGPEGAIEALAALGYEVRLVPESRLLPAVPEAAPLVPATFDERVQWVMDQVQQAGLVTLLNGLSGEIPVTIEGASQTLLTRYSFFSGCRLAEQYVFETLHAAGLAVEYQPFYTGTWRNVVATMPGVTRPGRQILVTAHLDDRPNGATAPGADDNGSGSAAVLRAAQIMGPATFDKTIKFICFTGEEQGLIGSYAYAEAAASRGDTIDAVVNLDMIAYESNDDDVFELHAGTTEASGAIADAFMDVNTVYGLGLVPEKITTGATSSSDHAAFWYYGYPAILAIEDFQDFTPYYHTVGDRVSTLDPGYFTRLAKAAIGTVATLAGPAWTTVVGASAPAVLLSLGPNPTRRGAVLRLSLPVPAEVRLDFFDLAGRRLRTLGGIRPAGVAEVAWDGLDAAGSAAPAGVVFYRASAGERVFSGRLVVLR